MEDKIKLTLVINGCVIYKMRYSTESRTVKSNLKLQQQSQVYVIKVMHTYLLKEL